MLSLKGNIGKVAVSTMSKTEAFLLMRNLFCELGINWLDFEMFAKKLDKVGNRNLKRWYDTIENYEKSQKNHKGLIIGVDFQTKKLIANWFQENSYVQIWDCHLIDFDLAVEAPLRAVCSKNKIFKKLHFVTSILIKPYFQII